MEQKKDILFRNQLALASLFFFRPLTKWMIKKKWFNISADDKSFVEWYIKIWLLSSVLLLIYIVIIFSKFYFRESILDPVSKILIIVILAIIILWIIWILSNVSIWKKLTIEQQDSNNKNLSLTYLPLINIYSRYNNHNFDKPDLINKESILIRSIFTILLLTGNLFITAIILILIIVRFVSLLMWIDIVNKDSKDILNRLFYINPEEIRWYVSGSIKYLVKNKNNKGDIKQFIETEKTDYKKLYNTMDILHIKIQYIVVIILLWLLVYLNLWNTSILLFTVLILWRYGIMRIKRNHLPSIPIIKGIIFWILKLYNRFTSKNNQ